MKLSTIDLPAMDKSIKPGPFYKAIRKMGYTGLEMVATDHFEIARDAGLELLSLPAPGMEVGINRDENLENLLPRITDIIYLAGENKIPYVIVFSGNRAGLSDAEGAESCRHALEELIPEALDNKVMILFEMMNTFDHPDYMADRAMFGIDLVTAIASPGLRVLYDVYHMHRMREDYVEDLTENIGAIAHIHCAESPDRSVPEAKGDIPYAELVPKAIKAGYKGYWGMELAFGREPLTELKAAADLFLSLG
jgi:hydroxypyruvate isomerase